MLLLKGMQLLNGRIELSGELGAAIGGSVGLGVGGVRSARLRRSLLLGRRHLVVQLLHQLHTLESGAALDVASFNNTRIALATPCTAHETKVMNLQIVRLEALGCICRTVDKGDLGTLKLIHMLSCSCLHQAAPKALGRKTQQRGVAKADEQCLRSK